MAESIPIGYRFLPTDGEMLAYLESLTLIKDDDDQNHQRKDVAYYGFIRWATLYDTKPWELYKDDGYDHDDEAGDGNDLYFLTPLKKKFQNGSRHARTVKTTLSSGEEETIGTWKFQTGPTSIIDYKTRKPLGVKREATFIPNMTEDNEDDQDAGTSCRSSSKKRKNPPEEMQGIRYIMHEYCLNPCDDQVYSLCRIRRKIDKKKIRVNKKMRRSSSPTTNTTTSTVVQPNQEERAAGYDHHQQEINSICYNDGQQQQQEAVLPPEGDVQIISDEDKGLLADIAEDLELWGVELNEDLLSRLEQDEAATAGGDLLYYGNDRYDHVDHQEVMNNAGVSQINIYPHGENNIFYNNGQQQQQQQQMAGYEHNQYHHQEVMYGDFVLNYEQEQQKSVVVPAEEPATGVSSKITHHHHEENSIDGLQQQQMVGYEHDNQYRHQEVMYNEGDVQISDNDKGLASAMEADIVYREELLCLLEQDAVAARAAATTGATSTTGGDLLYYGNDRYDHVGLQEGTNTAGVSEINNIHPHVQISDDDKRSAQEIEEDLELPAEWWRQGATAEELGFFNIEELLRSCH